MKLTTEHDREKKKLTEELKYLKTKVNDLEQIKEDSPYQKVLYMEGSVWMS